MEQTSIGTLLDYLNERIKMAEENASDLDIYPSSRVKFETIAKELKLVRSEVKKLGPRYTPSNGKVISADSLEGYLKSAIYQLDVANDEEMLLQKPPDVALSGPMAEKGIYQKVLKKVQSMENLVPEPEYGVWVQKTEKSHQYFCSRCDGKESSPRKYCPRCGLNMCPPKGAKIIRGNE